MTIVNPYPIKLKPTRKRLLGMAAGYRTTADVWRNMATRMASAADRTYCLALASEYDDKARAADHRARLL